jgi:5-formyltetrahydrofolate cyclo-ligase
VIEEVRARKAALRAHVLSARAGHSAAERIRAETAIASHGVAACSGATTIAAYVSFGDEPPTSRLLQQLHAAGTEILLPVIEPDGLVWARYAGPEELVAGRLGVPEPAGERLPPDALAAADMILVPALAVDGAGNRLGRGAGYYDRALTGLAAQVVAVVYDDELVDAVPHEPHDRVVDAVLRPGGVSRSRPS